MARRYIVSRAFIKHKGVYYKKGELLPVEFTERDRMLNAQSYRIAPIEVSDMVSKPIEAPISPLGPTGPVGEPGTPGVIPPMEAQEEEDIDAEAEETKSVKKETKKTSKTRSFEKAEPEEEQGSDIAEEE